MEETFDKTSSEPPSRQGLEVSEDDFVLQNDENGGNNMLNVNSY